MEATGPLSGKSSYRIVDSNGFRKVVAQGDKPIMMSAMRLDDPDAIALPYVAAMLWWLFLMPPPKDVVCIGLGGGAAAKFIHKHLAGTRLVAVEIDPYMVDIARQHFGLATDDDRLSVVVGDGGAYVHSHPQSCDAILIDAYDSESGFPQSLTGEAFCGACHNALRADGALTIHFLGQSKDWLVDYCSKLGKFFSDIVVINLGDTQEIIAFKRLPQFDWALLSQRAQMLEPKLRLGLPDFVSGLEKRVNGAAE